MANFFDSLVEYKRKLDEGFDASGPQRSQEIRDAVPTNPAGSRDSTFSPDKGAWSHYRTISTPTPQAPASGGQRPTASGNLQAAIGNIISTGSSNPKQATLINPQTGDRQAVPVNSPQAQALFGEGYILEQTPGTPTAGARSATTGTIFKGNEVIPEGGLPTTYPAVPTATTTTTKIDELRTRASQVRTEAFEAVYGYTPDEWQDLDPSEIRRLRNQRVQNLARELGNYNDAILQVKEETKTAKEDALTALATYSELDLLDKLTEEEIQNIATSTGLSADVLMNLTEKKEEGYELKQLGDKLVAIRFNDETGEIELGGTYSPLKTSGSGGAIADQQVTFGGGNYPKAFVDWFNTFVQPEMQGPVGPSGTSASPNFILEQFRLWRSGQSQYGGEEEEKLSETEFFRQTVSDTIEAIEAGRGSREDGLKKLIARFPDKVNEIYDAFAAVLPG